MQSRLPGPINDWTADTEFNAALRAHGIIPDLRPTSSRSPSPPVPDRAPSPSLSDLLDDDDLESDLPTSVLESYRAQRLAETAVSQRNRKFGRVYPIGKVDYKKEVTDASAVDLEGEPEGSGTGVICYLFKDYLPDCKLLKPLLDQLAALYPSSKFCSIVSDHCIENYPDKNCPTLLVYRKGEMTGQIVGLGGMGGQNVTLKDVERIIFAFRGLDFELKVGADAAPSQFASRSSTSKPSKGSDEDDSDDDPTFVGGGKRSGIRQGAKGRGGRGAAGKDGEESDDYDL